MPHGLALVMNYKLKRLALEHNLTIPEPPPIPLAPRPSAPVILEGFATTAGDIDLARTRLAPQAFGILPKSVPLLFHHDDDRIAGEILSLDYTPNGSVWVKCRVDNLEAARCGGFSIAAEIQEFHIIDGDDFHAIVTKAELMEVSLTDRPCNVEAVVKERYTQPHLDFYDLMGKKVQLLQQLVVKMKEEQTA